MVVTDTTLLVQYVVDQETSVAAHAVRLRDPVWMAPHLSGSEVRSALMKYVRAGRMSLGQAIEASELAAALVDRTASVDGAQVMRASDRYGLSTYDAEYVVLARALGVRLVTSDRRVRAAVPDVALSPAEFLEL